MRGPKPDPLSLTEVECKALERLVLPLDMVDKSTSLSKPTSGRFCVMRQSKQDFSSRSEAPFECFCEHIHQTPRDLTLHPYLALVPLKRKSATRDKRAPRAPSIVGWFFRLPWLEFAGGLVVPPASHRALVAARVPLAMLHGGAQNGSRLASTPDGPAEVETAEKWPRYGEQGLPRASRMVRVTRSRKAVFSRPERPKLSKAALRASCVPRRLTGVTRPSLRRRELFFTWP